MMLFVFIISLLLFGVLLDWISRRRDRRRAKRKMEKSSKITSVIAEKTGQYRWIQMNNIFVLHTEWAKFVEDGNDGFRRIIYLEESTAEEQMDYVEGYDGV